MKKSAVLSELSSRQRQILNLLVNHHINTAEPVGSRTLVRTYRLPLGPATIRNEMSDLEDLGFLSHPHTSAGRVPTDKGYRAFVDGLETPGLTPQEQDSVAQMTTDYLQSSLEHHNLLGSTIRLLSDLTRLVGVAAYSAMGQGQIEKIELVHVGHGRVLAVFVSTTGVVETFTVNSEGDIPKDVLGRLSETLSRAFSSKSVGEFLNGYIEVLSDIQREYRLVIRDMIERLCVALRQEAEPKLLIEGAMQILELPEFQVGGQTREFLSGKNQKYKEELIDLLKQEDTAERGPRVIIGEETKNQLLTDIALVMANYQLSADHRGVIAIIGPRRMDYRKVMACVDHIATVVSKRLRGA